MAPPQASTPKISEKAAKKAGQAKKTIAKEDKKKKNTKKNTKKNHNEIVAKRYRRVLRDNIQGITKPDFRRLARRAGVQRMSGGIYAEARGVLKDFLEKVNQDAVIYTEHAEDDQVTTKEVLNALQRQGRTVYGLND